MVSLDDYNRIMTTQTNIALATSDENKPNVRIVNFCHHFDNKNVIYFSTFRGNQKIDEFNRNSQVALTTIPLQGIEHVRIRNAQVIKSNLTVYDLQDLFVSKMPDYQEMIAHAGSQLELYEIHFNQVQIIIDYNNEGTITF